jgi:hypothetical protein
LDFALLVVGLWALCLPGSSLRVLQRSTLPSLFADGIELGSRRRVTQALCGGGFWRLTYHRDGRWTVTFFSGYVFWTGRCRSGCVALVFRYMSFREGSAAFLRTAAFTHAGRGDAVGMPVSNVAGGYWVMPASENLCWFAALRAPARYARHAYRIQLAAWACGVMHPRLHFKQAKRTSLLPTLRTAAWCVFARTVRLAG